MKKTTFVYQTSVVFFELSVSQAELEVCYASEAHFMREDDVLDLMRLASQKNTNAE